MEVRYPMPAQVPSLPLGYQVVEIADEPAPAAPFTLPSSPSARGEGRVRGARAQTHGARRLEQTSNAPRLPSSPLGYEVVQVGEEGRPGKRQRHSPLARAPKAPFPRHQRPPLYWTVIAVAGMSLGIILIALIAAAQPLGASATSM